jgi:hypothetical protein
MSECAEGLLTDNDLTVYANRGDIFTADGMGAFDGPDGQETSLEESWYVVN